MEEFELDPSAVEDAAQLVGEFGERERQNEATAEAKQVEYDTEQKALTEQADPREADRWGLKAVAKEAQSAVTGGFQDTASSVATFPERTIDALSGEMAQERKEKGFYEPDWQPFKSYEDPIVTKTWWGNLMRGAVHFGTMALGTVAAAKGLAVTGIPLLAGGATALLKAVHIFNNKFIGKMDLAERACDIEINQLKQPSGKQDQYISVYGGISEFNINKSGKVRVKNLNISKDIISKLEKNLLLFFTGFSRNSSLILNEQDNKTKKKEKDMIENLDFVKSIGLEIKNELVKGNCEGFAKLMNTHWKYKLKRSKNMSNNSIDNLYSYALKNGALGGKLIGAGGGGFLLFYTNSPKKLRKALKDKKLEEVSFNFDFQGVKQIF